MISFLNKEIKSLATAATIVAAFSFLSRFAGVIRDRILAGTFGAGPTLDSYYAAFVVPDLLFSLLAVGALSASFIPIFTKHYAQEHGKELAWRLVNNVVTILAVTMLAISGILFLLAPQIASLIAPSFPKPEHDLVTLYTRIMFISDFLLALSAVYGSALQGMKRFFIYALSPILYNLGIILGVVAFVPMIGPTGLAWGVVVGAAMHFALQFIGVSSAGYRFKWTWNVRDRDTREIARLMVPRTLGVAVGQLDDAILLMIATGLAAGSVTIYQYAYNIQFFAVGIVAVSFAVAAFPSLSESAAVNDKPGFVETLSQAARQILFFIIPATVVFLLLRAQIVRVVVGAGKFDWNDTVKTADTLAFFTLSFFAQGLVYLLARGFYAFRDSITPFIAGIVTATFTVVAGLLFSREFGVVGLSMAFSLASLVNLAMLWVMLRQKIGPMQEGKIVRSLLTISVAAVICGLVVQGMKMEVVHLITNDTFLGVLVQGLIAGGAGLFVYGAICWGLKSPEMLGFVSGLRKRLFKQYEPTENVLSEDVTL